MPFGASDIPLIVRENEPRDNVSGYTSRIQFRIQIQDRLDPMDEPVGHELPLAFQAILAAPSRRGVDYDQNHTKLPHVVIP
jgi:hypothetical protein